MGTPYSAAGGEQIAGEDVAAAEERDPKGLYKKARAGEIKNFTGIDDPYEAPEAPEVHLHTDQQSLEEEVNILMGLLEARGLIPTAP